MTEAKQSWICFCNKITREEIQKAIREKRARSLTDIYDLTTAGSGPCGGSCRIKISRILSEEQVLQRTTLESSDSPAQPPNGQSENRDNIPSEFVEAISLFNRRFYWESHESLESIWINEHGQRKLFYQGIIQAAAAFYHVLNANPMGVLKLAPEARRKLEPYQPVFMDLELSPLLAALEDFEKQAKEILGAFSAGFSYNKLPRLRLGKLMEV